MLKVRDAIAGLTEDVAKVRAGTGQISSSSQQPSPGIDQMTQGAWQMEKVIQTTAATAAERAAADRWARIPPLRESRVMRHTTPVEESERKETIMHGCLWAVALATVVALGGGQTAWAQLAATQPPAQGAPSTQATSAEPTVTWSAGATFTSIFVWRGFVVADAPSVQPSASMKIGNITATSWVNLIANGASRGWSEHDLIIDYTREAGAWTLSAGYTCYYFPTAETGRVSHEFYAGAAFSAPLNPSIRVYRDVTVGDGTYVSSGVSQALPLGDSKWSATPAVTLGYNNHLYVTGSGWSDLNLGVTLARPAGSHVDVAGSFNYSQSLHTEWFPSRAYFGVTVTVH